LVLVAGSWLATEQRQRSYETAGTLGRRLPPCGRLGRSLHAFARRHCHDKGGRQDANDGGWVWGYGAVNGSGRNLLLNGQECRVNNQQPFRRDPPGRPLPSPTCLNRKMKKILPILVFLWTALTVVTATCLQVQRPQYAFNGGQGLIHVPAIDPGPRGGA